MENRFSLSDFLFKLGVLVFLFFLFGLLNEAVAEIKRHNKLMEEVIIHEKVERVP